VSDAPPLDRAALLDSLNRHGVRFILVGGLAAQAYGASRATQDADICPEWSTENLAQLAEALTELRARLKIGERSVDTLGVDLDARTLHSFEIGAWRTSAGDVDVLLGIPAATRSDLLRYEQLAENAVELRIDQIRVLVASLADIIRSKEVVGRPKDREALDELRRLRDVRAAD
jgi:predicted nucleotidyltransferase